MIGLSMFILILASVIAVKEAFGDCNSLPIIGDFTIKEMQRYDGDKYICKVCQVKDLDV